MNTKTKRTCIALLTCAFLSQCGSDATLQDTNIAETHKQKVSNYPKYLEAGEPNVIALSGNRAKRQGNSLVLNLASGKQVTFVTRPTCVPNASAEEDCVFYHLMAIWPSRHAYLLSRSYF